MQEIYDHVFKAILEGHGTLGFNEPCIWYCSKDVPETTGIKKQIKDLI